MKVKDFIKLEEDIDVYDNIDESLAVAFCGAQELTRKGREHFEIALNLDIEIDRSGSVPVAVVDCHDMFFKENEEYYLEQAKEFFYSAAGYCADSDYKRWFK